MRVLVVIQKVDRNDEFFGFFHGRLLDFATRCDKVNIICLESGAHDLPASVRVHSLGKESQQSRLHYLLRFYRLLWLLRHEYDEVFVYLEPLYIVLGGIVWKLLGKRIILWYNHTHRSWRLRAATWLADIVMSPQRERFPLASKKLIVVGGRHELDALVCP